MLIFRARYRDRVGMFNVWGEEQNRPCRFLEKGLCLIGNLRGVGGANRFSVLLCVYDVVVLMWVRLMLVSFNCFLAIAKDIY